MQLEQTVNIPNPNTMKNKLKSILNWVQKPFQKSRELPPQPESNGNTIHPRERIRQDIACRYLHGNGIEIGALHAPLMVSEDATVRYVDRLSVEQLRQQYPELAELPLVDVDIIDDGMCLQTIDADSYDFVIASHVIEHFQNPILSIENALRIIKPGGIFYVAIPDKRYTFDRDRPLTSIDCLVAEYREQPTRSKQEYFEEYVRLVDKVPEEQFAARLQYLLDMDYSIHYHVWTVDTFTEFLSYCRNPLELGFEIEKVQPNTDEFICILRKQN